MMERFYFIFAYLGCDFDDDDDEADEHGNNDGGASGTAVSTRG
jgi:hypothetical protein